MPLLSFIMDNPEDAPHEEGLDRDIIFSDPPLRWDKELSTIFVHLRWVIPETPNSNG